MNPTTFKKIAYLALSDAKMLTKKAVNPYQLVDQLSVKWSVGATNKQPEYLGAIENVNNKITLSVYYNPSTIIANFTMATLVSYIQLNPNSKELIPVGYGFFIKANTPQHDNPWLESQTLATMLLCYSFSPRELRMLKAEGLKLEKNVSKLAHKKGIPTQFLLSRIAMEFNK